MTGIVNPPTSGQTDLTSARTAPYRPPVRPARASPFMVFNTETDFGVETVIDPAFTDCRWHAFAGAPHIPDNLRTRAFFHTDAAGPLQTESL